MKYRFKPRAAYDHNFRLRHHWFFGKPVTGRTSCRRPDVQVWPSSQEGRITQNYFVQMQEAYRYLATEMGTPDGYLLVSLEP